MNDKDISILIIYTGGTIGMMRQPDTEALAPVDFDQISQQVPELKRFGYKLDAHTFDPVIDSSNVNPSFWKKLAEIIFFNYDKYHGFVVLHGTDTMSYSASALSFMLENLRKPVIFTGSQLPIGTLRTDGKENLITAIEIAAAHKKNEAVVPEVCIYFENKLFRGNRTTKFSAEYFNAFRSDNYPALASTGVHINFNYAAICYPVLKEELQIHTTLSTDIAILKLFPGFNKNYINAILSIENLKALIVETYGSGNAPNDEWFINRIRKAIDKGLIILNVTQCMAGSVDMEQYETGVELMKAGVISGYDITTEAAMTKLMYLLGKGYENEEIIKYLNKSVRGEISV